MAAAIAAAALVVVACSDDGTGEEGTEEDEGGGEGEGTTPDDAPSALRVGSFDFPESELLAELYAQVLEAADVDVERLGAIGPREIVAPALEQDQIDLVPEYLGTATGYFGAGRPAPAAPNLADLRDRLESKGLIALAVAPAENTNVFVVLVDSGLGPRISDLSAVAETLRFGGPPECRDRPLCLAGLETRYGLRFAEFVPQPSLRITAEALRRDEIDVGLMFSTDAAVTEEFLVLEDDKVLQAAENVVPVIRVDALTRWGDETVTAALDAVSAALTTEDLRALNRRVATGDDVAVVAAEWLSEHGLVDEG